MKEKYLNCTLCQFRAPGETEPHRHLRKSVSAQRAKATALRRRLSPSPSGYLKFKMCQRGISATAFVTFSS